MADSGLRTFLIFLVICGAIAFVFRKDVAKFAGIKLEPAARPVNIDPEALQKVYRSLKLEPLDEQLTAEPVIARALKDLTISLCDKTAIFRLSNGLARQGERKPAATAFLGFAEACPNSEGELYAGANILFGMGDYAAVLPVADRLIEMRPDVGQYYYTRGQALSALGRHDDAVNELTTALTLVDDMRMVNSGVFTGLAEAYAATGRHCQAMTAIQTYVHADSHKRDTAQTRKLISDYGAKGNCKQSYAQGSEVIPRIRPDITVAKVTINGTTGSFIVDTGASMVALSPEFAARAKTASSPNSRRLLMHTANGVVDAALVTIGRLEVGKVSAENVSAAIMSKSLGPGIDGLLGMSFLARFDVTLDAKTVRIKERLAAQTATEPN